MYLGLDLGTSSLKGVIVNECGAIVASHSVALEVSRPHDGWSEQDPDCWIDAARTVFNALATDLPRVRAIGLSGHMHGAVCLDVDDNVIRPCILWNDSRAATEAAQLDNKAALKAIFGNITFAGFTAPKILWMRRHEPANYARIKKILLPKDYLRLWLTGEYLSDMSDASGTAWLDIGGRDWSDDLLNASGLDRSHMPQLVEGSDQAGKLRTTLAREFALADGVVIAGGAGDNAATAVGLGVTDYGSAFVSLGTSGVVFAPTAGFAPNPDSALHAFAHALPNRWHQMGVTLSATDSLNWLARQLTAEPANLVDALGVLGDPSAELFLPFLAGERTPYNSTTMRAGFHNLGHDTDRAALTRAVLEGVGFSLRESLDLIEGATNPIEKIVIAGGGARSNYWTQLLATIFQKPIQRIAGADNAAALGAAMLGAMAIGEQIKPDTTGDVFESLAIDDYEAKFERYKALIAVLNVR